MPLMLASLWGMAASGTGTGDGGRGTTAAADRPRRRGRERGGDPGAAVVGAVRAGHARGLAGSSRWPGEHVCGRSSGTAASIALGPGRRHGPWWVRNASIYGRFVPTALWMGASLYDGLNPRATGASDMRFLEEPEIWPLDELDQDAELTRRAVAFARDQPRRALELAVVKLGRYWSPWPNAEGFARRSLAAASAVVVVPLLGLVASASGAARRSAGLGLAGRAAPVLLRPAHGLRQLDAVPDSRPRCRPWGWRRSGCRDWPASQGRAIAAGT